MSFPSALALGILIFVSLVQCVGAGRGAAALLSAQKALRKMRVNEKEKKRERGKGGSDGSRQRWRKASEKDAAAGEEDKKTNPENNSCPTWMVNAGI